MISVLKIWGQTGSEMEFFESFSQSMPRIFLILGLKEHIMALDVYLRFGVQINSRSRVTGPNGSKTLRYEKSFELLYFWFIFHFLYFFSFYHFFMKFISFHGFDSF